MIAEIKLTARIKYDRRTTFINKNDIYIWGLRQYRLSIMGKTWGEPITALDRARSNDETGGNLHNMM